MRPPAGPPTGPLDEPSDDQRLDVVLGRLARGRYAADREVAGDVAWLVTYVATLRDRLDDQRETIAGLDDARLRLRTEVERYRSAEGWR